MRRCRAVIYLATILLTTGARMRQAMPCAASKFIRVPGLSFADENEVGPKQRGVLAALAGAVPGYNYSQALQKFEDRMETKSRSTNG